MTNLPTIRDFNTNIEATQQSHASIVESARANKETEAAVILAKRFPRDEQAAVNRILNACSRPSLANKSIYSFKRGGQKVEGPSIRLAEVIAKNWGNLQFGIKEVERRKSSSVVEAFCWDLETNTKSSKEFCVMHTRDTKEGPKKLTNERDIYEMIANQGARRLRNCILSCIPEDVTDLASDQVNKTLLLSAKGSAIDIQDRIRKMLESFQELKVTRDMIENYLNVKPEAASSKQIVDLGKIYSSIKEGYSEAKDWFKVSEHSIQDAIVREDVKKSNDQEIEEAEKLMRQAIDLGIEKETLDKIQPDLSKPSEVTRSIQMLKTIISDRLLDVKNGVKK